MMLQEIGAKDNGWIVESARSHTGRLSRRPAGSRCKKFTNQVLHDSSATIPEQALKRVSG